MPRPDPSLDRPQSLTTPLQIQPVLWYRERGPPHPQRGLVSNATEWEYYFHGCGCCFTHRVTGEAIDVDFFDHTADWFERYFYAWYLKSLARPPFSEERLLAVHGGAEPVMLSFLDLADAGILECHPEGRSFKLVSECLALDDRLDVLERLWDTPAGRMAVAASLGDWLFVAEQLRPDDPERIDVHRRADGIRNTENQYLQTMFSGEHGELALQAMAGLKSPMLDDCLERTIQGNPSGVLSAALDIIATLPMPKWHEPLFKLLGRIDPNGDIPLPHIWITAARHLLQQGYRTKEVLQQLPRMQRHELGEAALLALELMPEAALDLFRRALRSTIPYNRITAAAALAIIDAPWSQEEQSAVLRESDEQLATAECRAALMASRSTDMHRLVETWETRNPREAEHGQWITMEEMSLRNRDNVIQWEIQKLHNRVLPLRGRVPPKSLAKWNWLPRWLRRG